jgi:hypothetical protein
MRRIRPRSIYDVLAVISFFLVIGGGTALASYVVSSNSQVGPGTISGHHPPSGKHANIINGSIAGSDVAGGGIGSSQLANGAVTTSKIANNAVTKYKLGNSSVTWAKLAGSASGAWGMVSADGTLARSFDIQSVSHTPGTGVYCIALVPASGINPASAVLVATPNFAQDETSDGTDLFAHVEWNSTGCPGTGMRVDTFLVAPNANGSGGMSQQDEGFSFYVRPF